MKARGLQFLEVPLTYYTTLRERLKKSKIRVTEDMDMVNILTTGLMVYFQFFLSSFSK